jgi:chromosome segregation ATPase
MSEKVREKIIPQIDQAEAVKLKGTLPTTPQIDQAEAVKLKEMLMKAVEKLKSNTASYKNEIEGKNKEISKLNEELSDTLSRCKTVETEWTLSKETIQHLEQELLTTKTNYSDLMNEYNQLKSLQLQQAKIPPETPLNKSELWAFNTPKSESDLGSPEPFISLVNLGSETPAGLFIITLIIIFYRFFLL